MHNTEAAMRVSIRSAALRLAVVLVTAILATATIVLSAPRPARATPQFATQTGLPCSQCHQNATGGPLTDFGKAFQGNGNKVPQKK